MLLNQDNFKEHVPWLAASLVVTVLATGWFFFAAAGQARWPSGSSIPGLTFGLAGGLICLFEFLIWPRKKLRSWRLGKMTTWMRAHIWLGLVAVPLLILHTGFRWGGPLSTILMALFFIVVLSGIWGLVAQQFLPSTMLKEVQAETVYSQIDHVSTQMETEGHKLVTLVCGQAVGEKSEKDMGNSLEDFLVVGAVRKEGLIQGRFVSAKSNLSCVPNSEPLRNFYHQSVKHYLLEGEKGNTGLESTFKARMMFQAVKLKLDTRAYEAVAILESFCDQRRQLDRQARLHFRLHGWLLFHLPLSVALIVLMFVHIFAALKYW
ncbi:MAG: hypothetical protein EXR99_06055 [Gemmataceae bacterium]|nr:hypothetical protein [Gemmataceae bacterium]